jgi:hypothetical protein
MDLGHGLVFVESSGPGTRWRLEAHDVKRLRELIGEELLVALARAFSGADRIASLYYALALDEAHCEAGSVAHERNVTTLVLMSWGTLYETALVLQGLHAKGLRDRLTSLRAREALDELHEFGKRWRNGHIASLVRSGLAFHLGKCDEVKQGLDALCDAGEPLTLFYGDSGLLRDARVGFGLDLVLKAKAIGEKPAADFLKRSRSDASELSDRLQIVMFDLLHSAGVKMPGLDAKPISDRERPT